MAYSIEDKTKLYGSIPADKVSTIFTKLTLFFAKFQF